jgi:MFS family permease
MASGRFWYIPLIFLCLVQFGAMADDSTFANSLSAITLDLHATVAQMQFANMIYSLMAGSVMIAAGLLGSKIGLKRLLLIGLIIIALAEAVVWSSPNIYVLVYVGRVLAGIGGSLCVPALLGLVTAMYSGRQVAIAYGCIGATTAIGSSIAPILSGLIIVYIGWRFSFLLLTLLFIAGWVGSLLTITATPIENKTPSFDKIGFLLLLVGFTTFMFGIAHITSWGLLDATDAPFKLFGFSPVIFLIFFGIFTLGLFWLYEVSLEKRVGTMAVLVPSCFIKDKAIIGGILMSAYVFYILGGLIFSIVIYMQIVLSESPIMSGLYITIFSLGMSLSSIGTSFIGKNLSPKRLSQIGIILTSGATLLIMAGLQTTYVSGLFYPGLFFVGIGVGIVASQCNLAVVSAIDSKELANKSSGIQGAARNIGESFGIAIIGIMIMLGLTASIKNHVFNEPLVPASIQTEVKLSHSIPFLSNKDLRAYLDKQHVDQAAAAKLISINEIGRLHAMRVTLLMMCLSGLLFLFATRGMVSKKLKDISID